MAGTPVTDISQIELAVESFLVARIAAIRKGAVQKDMRFIFTNPALVVAIIRGRSKPLGPGKFRSEVVINVMVTFSSAKGEEDRRKGVNPLVMGIMRTLARRRLDLDITDILPRGWEEVTTEELWKENKIAYNVEFETSFLWRPQEDDEGPDLLGIGVEYFLQPGDDTADAADDIIIT